MRPHRFSIREDQVDPNCLMVNGGNKLASIERGASCEMGRVRIDRKKSIGFHLFIKDGWTKCDCDRDAIAKTFSIAKYVVETQIYRIHAQTLHTCYLCCIHMITCNKAVVVTSTANNEKTKQKKKTKLKRKNSCCQIQIVWFLNINVPMMSVWVNEKWTRTAYRRLSSIWCENCWTH